MAAGLAAWFDLRTREIPDWITIFLILAGIVFSLVERGFWVTGGTLLLGSTLAELLYRRKVFGGGDLKLLLGLALTGGRWHPVS
ncbi:MAG: Type leader peptidase family [Clostridia bacterium]|nr:Type leader peptidase family [Clostridia bacterium]